MIASINLSPTADTEAVRADPCAPGASMLSPKSNDTRGFQAASVQSQKANVHPMQFNYKDPDAGTLTAIGSNQSGTTGGDQNHNRGEYPSSEKSEREATAMTSRSKASVGDETSIASHTVIYSVRPGNDITLRTDPGAAAVLHCPSPPQANASLTPIDHGGTVPVGTGTLVDELRALLGRNTVLLPIPSRRKGPIITGWQRTTLEEMENACYLAGLADGNIGVLLGSKSAGLCAIDVDGDDELAEFLDLNPNLRCSLITKGARGAQIWCRILSEYPELAKLKDCDGKDWGEWRADGGQSVIFGVHPTGVHYQRLNNAPPVEVEFKSIKWPPSLKLPWVVDHYERLLKQHGPPYRKRGALTLNDYFFAAKFMLEHPLIWEPQESEFYGYNPDNGVWRISSQERLRHEMGISLKTISDETGIDDFVFYRTDGKMASWINTLKGMAEEHDVFKNRPQVIHCANGMLDLSVTPPHLKSFHPDYHSRNICPINLNPTAGCPQFLDGLLRSALPEEDVELLQIWAGGVLLGRNPAQRVLLLVGTAGGGKSTVIEVIEKVIGEQNVAQIRTQHLGKQFEMYKFLGKTLLTGKDVDPDFLNQKDASVIKALVGNDLLDAEKKNGNEHFQLRGSFNVAITCNGRLTVRLQGDVEAWERRLIIVEYDRERPEERISDFADKLIREEGAGILNWIVEGSMKYLREIADFGNIRLTPKQSYRVQRLLQESDSLHEFVRSRIERAPLDTLTVKELQAAYRDFCEEMGWRSFTPRDLSGATNDLMLQLYQVRPRHDISRGSETLRGFKGVRLIGKGAL